MQHTHRDGEVAGRWGVILRDMHVHYYHRMADDFSSSSHKIYPDIKRTFAVGTYDQIFGFLQWVMRHPNSLQDFDRHVDQCLKLCRSAYRVVNGDTIAPVSSSEERDTLVRAFTDLGATEFNGARQHLKLAAERSTAGDWADCIRESINAVEATVRCIDPEAKDLGPALAELKKRGTVHGSLKQGLQNLYGYASDQKGVRHSLVFEDAANVDETDALFMLGACAAFVSYLINKGRAGGLIMCR